MKKKFSLLFIFFCIFSFAQKIHFENESKWFINEFTGNAEIIEGSNSKVKTTVTLHLDKKIIFVERDVFKNNAYSHSRVNQYNIIEVIEQENNLLFKVADLLYRQYVEIILAKDDTYLSISTKCDSKNCPEFDAYY
ncbi:hypothetical protein [Frigoriflavimonas asaccharolytica]|uniref:Uncharacterized protein n=1 Tax=Frigoriflavimonas asaccharolytica TaxID=2735899 RepID=A0A8J8GDY7_9FLAO|nr:hypothetical protein [Frigoriflavimonas asaccharolytica]NRS94180.1 hypothetical protein [Frigoriflavimonas asaccharolytica]